MWGDTGAGGKEMQDYCHEGRDESGRLLKLAFIARAPTS
jgi:hypothetical protein